MRTISTLNMTGHMQQPQLISFWGSEGNSFANSDTCCNGGGYRQPYGGALWFVPGMGDVVVDFEDTSCGDFGSRWNVQIEICATGHQWLMGIDQLRDSDEQQEDRCWNSAASHGVYRVLHGISGQWLVRITREVVETAAYRMQRAAV